MNCPCHSNKPYEACCASYHRGAKAPNALVLMRSRYSAYAMSHIDYILKTTHPKNQDYAVPIQERKAQIEAFCTQTKFEGLTIISFEEHESAAYVTFRAQLSQEGRDTSFTEKSQFAKINNSWHYLKYVQITRA